MNYPYFDVHTHHLPSGNKNIVAISNIMPGNDIPDSWFSAGLHPWYLTENFRGGSGRLEHYLSHQYCVAIGEAGLDKYCDTAWGLQERAFRWQLQLAVERQMPVIVHCVRAWNELLAIRKGFTDQKWVLHGFNSSLQMAGQLADTGCMLSFGSMLFKNSRASRTFRYIPEPSILLETDESAYSIQDVYQKAAEIKGMELDELRALISANFARVFPNVRL